MAAHPDKWLLRRPDPKGDARLFCFPYAGVGASMFARWPRWIGGAEVCPIQFPGRENRIGEEHFRTYTDLADKIVDALHPWLGVPYAFFGHCSGALPAYETALLIDSRRLPPPARLYVSGQVAPHDSPFDRLIGLDDDELRAELSKAIQHRGGPAAQPALIEIALRVLRADLSATASYLRSEPVSLTAPITAMHWESDVEIERNQIDGWLHYGDADIVVLDGGHYDLLDAPDPLQRLLASWVPN